MFTSRLATSSLRWWIAKFTSKWIFVEVIISVVMGMRVIFRWTFAFPFWHGQVVSFVLWPHGKYYCKWCGPSVRMRVWTVDAQLCVVPTSRAWSETAPIEWYDVWYGFGRIFNFVSVSARTPDQLSSQVLSVEQKRQKVLAGNSKSTGVFEKWNE